MNVSHTGMVVPECFKGDSESQWKMDNLTSRGQKIPEPIVTKIVMGDHVGDLYPVQNLGVFAPIYAKLLTKVTRLLFYLFGSDNSLPPRRKQRFYRSIRQTTSFLSSMCLWGPR